MSSYVWRRAPGGLFPRSLWTGYRSEWMEIGSEDLAGTRILARLIGPTWNASPEVGFVHQRTHSVRGLPGSRSRRHMEYSTAFASSAPAARSQAAERKTESLIGWVEPAKADA